MTFTVPPKLASGAGETSEVSETSEVCSDAGGAKAGIGKMELNAVTSTIAVRMVSFPAWSLTFKVMKYCPGTVKFHCPKHGNYWRVFFHLHKPIHIALFSVTRHSVNPSACPYLD